MDGIHPTNITVNKKSKNMTVAWSDGHTSVYTFSLLRHACPCEQCRGGHDQMSDEPLQEVFYMPEEDTPATRLASVEATGSYGVNMQWEDGHTFGIYTWHYLRACCPCSICQELRIYGQ